MFFEAADFNQNIASWEMKNVKDTSSMFANATAFNQNIGSWQVDAVHIAFGPESTKLQLDVMPHWRRDEEVAAACM